VNVLQLAYYMITLCDGKVKGEVVPMLFFN